MVKKLAMLMLALMASCVIYAQNTPPITYTVKGILLDSLTQEAEPYATIRIVRKEAPDKAIKMAVTDNKGRFQEKLVGDGDYVMTITSIGKTAVNKEFTLRSEEKTVDFGTLYTADAANELQGVEIVAQKPLVKVDIDKIEYNIADDPDSKTNSILEMLRKVPLVTVDGEDKIQVNGSSSFKIHVNGKPNNMMSDNPTEVLKSMPASTIKHIEVITNPGAKYDAEGIGGILNIVTTVDSGIEGYTATFSGNANNNGIGGSVYATIKKDKLTLSGRYSYNLNDRPRSYSDNTRDNVNDSGVTTSQLISSSSSKNKGSFQHGSLEGSYEIDTLRLITMSFGMYGGGSDGDSDGSTLYQSVSGTSFTPIYKYGTYGSSDYSWFSIRGNIDYQRSFKKKDRLLTFSYNINTRPQDSDVYTNYRDTANVPLEYRQFLRLQNMHSDGEQNTTEHTFQTDYTTPIGKYHTVEGGAKYIIRNNISDDDRYLQNASGKYELDMQSSSHYKHLNDILAAYLGYTVRYKSLSGKVGVRYERTMLDVEYAQEPDKDFNVDYNDVVPSASIGLKIGQTKNIRAGYNMRIWRPSIYFLNPYRDETNPTYVRQGNPDLESEKSHALNLSYSSFTTKFNVNLSLNYSFNNNGIEQVQTLMNPGTDQEYLYSTYENIGKSRYAGLSGYVNWNASPKTRIYMNLNGGYNSLKSPSQNLENSGWSGFAYGGVQHTLPWDLRVSLNLMGGLPQVMLQGEGDSFYDYSMSLNKSFLKEKRLTLSVFASNIITKYRTYNSTVEGVGFKQSSKSKYAQQRFGMSVSYRIGELKATVKKAARAISNDDVKGGEGGGQGGGE